MKSKLLVLLIVFIFVGVGDVFAAGAGSLAHDILTRFYSSAVQWASVIESAASRIFMILVTISMVWTFGFMALRRADLGEFFAELIRFMVFVGFFWWLLTNAITGQNIAGTIVSGLMQLGQEAASLPTTSFGPDSLITLGFAVFDDAMAAAATYSWREFTSSFMLNAIGVAVLLVLVLVAVNMMLLLISSWLLLYIGVFFLGFGGTKWTSDIAINYFKSVLGVGVQLMTMILLASIGRDFIADVRAKVETVQTGELLVLLICAIILLVLVNNVPPLLAGVVTGSSVGNLGIGNFGAGAMVGAMSSAAGAMVSASTALKGAMGGQTSSALGAVGGAGAMSVMEAVNRGGGSNAGDLFCTMPSPTMAAAGAAGRAFDSMSGGGGSPSSNLAGRVDAAFSGNSLSGDPGQSTPKGETSSGSGSGGQQPKISTSAKSEGNQRESAFGGYNPPTDGGSAGIGSDHYPSSSEGSAFGSDSSSNQGQASVSGDSGLSGSDDNDSPDSNSADSIKEATGQGVVSGSDDIQPVNSGSASSSEQSNSSDNNSVQAATSQASASGSDDIQSMNNETSNKISDVNWEEEVAAFRDR